MREILFKAKRLDNGEWISGSLVCFAGGARAILPSDSETLFSKSKGFICCDTCHDVDPSTVCEWTGLIDRDGTKVFEGDRLFDPHEKRTFVVEYDPLEAGFILESNDGRYVNFNRVPYSKIIGNIYDREGNDDD